LVQSVAELNMEIRSAVTTFGMISSDVLQAATLGAGTAEQLEAAADKLASLISTRRNSLLDEVSQARISLFASAFAALAPSLEPNIRLVGGSSRAGPASDELRRILDRMPASATAETIEECRSLADQYASALNPHEQERVISSIRFKLQGAQDRDRLIDRNKHLLEGLYKELDGLTGRDIEALRGRLKGTRLDAPLPADLPHQVAKAARAAVATEDREYLLSRASDILKQLGYVVGAEFVTAVARDGAILNLRDSDRHGIHIRQRERELLVNVVRFDEFGQRDPIEDMHAEERFCTDLAALRAGLHDNGVILELKRLDPPGSHPAQVVRRAPQRAGPRPNARNLPEQPKRKP